jgi:hypothetical protein
MVAVPGIRTKREVDETRHVILQAHDRVGRFDCEEGAIEVHKGREETAFGLVA